MVKFAERAMMEQDPAVLQMLEIAERPEVISFAGGLPAPETFPVAEISDIMVEIMATEGSRALQYSSAQGLQKLREQIAERMYRVFGAKVTADEILITSGSQQGLDLTGKVFLDKDDVVFCESPTYMAAINAFRSYQPQFISIAADAEGMVVPELEKRIQENPRAKLVYVIPDFQNPTGNTWSVERRREFINMVKKYDIAVIEDNPYGELRFEGQLRQSIKSMDTKGQVVYLGTFSKTFCPGLRLGWVAAAPPVLEKYLDFKQTADLHTASLTQLCLAKYMEKYSLDENVESIKDVYRVRRDVMLECIEKEFPENVHTQPQGGLFIWAELPEGVNAAELLDKALAQNVAYVPGGAFFANGGHKNTMRLNFSNMPEDKIREGIKRLGKVLKEEIK